MSTPEPHIQPGLPHPFAAGLSCRCPRCGKGRLFRSFFSLTLADRCTNCGLDYTFIDSGDGPAVFAIFILGFLVLGGALIAEFKFGIPLWAHIVLWGLLTPLVAIGLLKGLKGVLAALQFRYKAEQAGPAEGEGNKP
ncbi:MAG: DUF983 domain-containing protein [Hyphomicrobiaceae bacterium]